jgi:choline dehydrogenase-like flavoprotein
MSTSSENGVVNENLKVFDMDNLFICDGSVFPTSGNANSSLTISALACRLADYLIKAR